MADVLLLGAGFSRNWGGLLAGEVFEHLLSVPQVQSDAYLRDMLWRYSRKGGFEYALSEVQDEWTRQPEKTKASLHALQKAIAGVFDTMNSAFLSRNTMEFTQDSDYQIRRFFVRFDAIFTLNQDVLLEHHYLPHVELAAPDRWRGPQIMGVRRTGTTQGGPESWAREIWVPADPQELKSPKGFQPLYKLHGSSNWRDEKGGQLLVVGGNKGRTIESQKALAWCLSQFAEQLSAGSSRLMVIGYSFRDEHINQVIVNAVRGHSLRLFVIDPLGADVVRYANPSFGGVVYSPGDLDEAFKIGLVGASRRGLGETFGTDYVSFCNVTRFLESEPN